MGKMRLKKRKKLKKLDIIFIVFLLICVLTYYSIRYLSKMLTPILLETGEIKINKYSTVVVNKAISQVLEDKINEEELFTTTKSESGRVDALDFNPMVVNQILSIATTVVLNDLKLLESGELDQIGIDDLELEPDEKDNLKKGIIAYVPVGAATNVTLLSNLGPKIPIKLHYIGDINSNITTKITSYGINNALIEIGIHLEITAKIILPFTTSTKVLNADIPIAIKMIQGNVPSYYYGSSSNNSNIYSTPVE